MRWLLLKDLQILRRSPLLVALLVLYPIVIAVLIGFALSRGPDKPKVAFYNGLEGKSAVVELGGDRIDLAEGGPAAVRRHRPGARGQQGGGDPEGQGRRRARRADHPERPRRRTSSRSSSRGRSRSTTTPRTRRSGSSSRTRSRRRCRRPTARSPKRVAKEALQLLDLISKGGDYSFLGQNFDVLGLQRRRDDPHARRGASCRPARPSAPSSTA